MSSIEANFCGKAYVPESKHFPTSKSWREYGKTEPCRVYDLELYLGLEVSEEVLSGFRLRRLRSGGSRLLVPPSQTRWSKVSVSSVTLRTASSPFTTYGLSMIRPTPRMATFG